MSVQIPKNVRLCGTAAEGMAERIYLEDYVVTFLRQAQDRYGEREIRIDLYGRSQIEGKLRWIFVYGACMSGEQGCFPDYDYLGQARYAGRGETLSALSELPGEADTLHIALTGEAGELLVFYRKDGYVRRADAFFVFYEKNEAMQNCLMAWYRKGGQEREAEPADTAARRFRSLYQERQQERRQSRMLSAMYTAALLLLILCCVTGISMMNQVDRMREMGQAIDHLTLAMEERQLPERSYAAALAQKYDVSVINTDGTETAAASAMSGGVQAKEGAEAAGDAEAGSADAAEEAAPERGTQGGNSGQTEAGSADAAEEAAPERGTQGGNDGQTETGSADAAEEAAPEHDTDVTNDTEAQEAADGSGQTEYIVQKGDTLAEISRSFYGTSGRIAELCALNRIADPNHITVGQKLLLPNEGRMW